MVRSRSPEGDSLSVSLQAIQRRYISAKPKAVMGLKVYRPRTAHYKDGTESAGERVWTASATQPIRQTHEAFQEQPKTARARDETPRLFNRPPSSGRSTRNHAFMRPLLVSSSAPRSPRKQILRRPESKVVVSEEPPQYMRSTDAGALKNRELGGLGGKRAKAQEEQQRKVKARRKLEHAEQARRQLLQAAKDRHNAMIDRAMEAQDEAAQQKHMSRLLNEKAKAEERERAVHLLQVRNLLILLTLLPLQTLRTLQTLLTSSATLRDPFNLANPTNPTNPTDPTKLIQRTAPTDPTNPLTLRTLRTLQILRILRILRILQILRTLLALRTLRPYDPANLNSEAQRC